MQVDRENIEKFTFTISEQEVHEMLTAHVAKVFQVATGKSLGDPAVDVDMNWETVPDDKSKYNVQRRFVARVELNHLYVPAEGQ